MKWLKVVLLPLASTAAADHNWEQRNIVAGQSLYADNCASCHGAKLEEQPNWKSLNTDDVLPAPPHDRTGHTWHLVKHSLMMRYGIFQPTSDQLGLSGNAKSKPIGTHRTDGTTTQKALDAVLSDK